MDHHSGPASAVVRTERWGLGAVLFVAGTAAGLVAAVVQPDRAGDAASQSWRPFVLVAGLLALGLVAGTDGLFDRLADGLARRQGTGRVSLAGSLLLVAVVTALLNLDTAVAFMTPVVVLAARRRGGREDGALYGTLFMANAASLLLPGSNLTNLLVFADHPLSGAQLAAHMWVAWLAAVVVTVAVTLVAFRSTDGLESAAPEPRSTRRIPLSTVVAMAGVAIALVALSDVAVVVLTVAVVLAAARLRQGRLRMSELWRTVDVATLVGLFGLAVALGTLARSWSAPAELLDRAGPLETALIGTSAAVAVNNLPAAVLLSAGELRHPFALLVGLNVGPNLAVSGSLSALLWFKAAATVGCQPSLRRVTAVGAVLVPITIAVALLGLSATGSL